ncbi:hypothetical protein UFOVP1028_11 [uncultured Caudovirales phage]|uniref:Uncharacterized protein n=1 Tax=uncultured Caudovirales phage TaxID=2100421 RepID=A0A6J5R7B3_9CAUD|nr:hypothetical protein UFOVP960_22 [uncultured Caudovirales phage]CAB4178856.1 hypothetical protein UFOVP1028_11 [uncultured Caudovirales phage]CAB4189411.1 hypothetical protein UFOVP1187_8 [uncultured Caudovirales phage]CAB4192308.1 hypothetical protein UFOVP1235_25 [uncultured Caudovirales phage]CAB4215778.1 hypothetical protein UFOVP1488_8 [uncultured Caudovirales phage]
MIHPDHFDDELDCTVRRCRACREWWPLTSECYQAAGSGHRLRTCNACRVERGIRRHVRAAADNARKAAQRRDPERRGALLARQRDAQSRYYERNRAAELERNRLSYAARLDRPVRLGFGRPRIIP